MKKYARTIGLNNFILKCTGCSSTEVVQFHHKNKNKWDNRLSNLQPLCLLCHRRHHEDKDWKSVHKQHSKWMRNAIKSGEFKIWNKGLTKDADIRLAKYGEKQSVTKHENPMKLSKHHINILVKASHTKKVKIKRSKTIKRLWRTGIWKNRRIGTHGPNGNF